MKFEHKPKQVQEAIERQDTDALRAMGRKGADMKEARKEAFSQIERQQQIKTEIMELEALLEQNLHIIDTNGEPVEAFDEKDIQERIADLQAELETLRT